MTLIEGVGDEVTLLFAVGVIVFIIILAWISTNIHEIPFFSVIIVELTQRRRQRANANNDNEATTPLADNVSPNSTSTEGSSETGGGLQAEESPVTEASSSGESGQRSPVSDETEVETTVRFVNVLDNSRIEESAVRNLSSAHRRREEGHGIENSDIVSQIQESISLPQTLNETHNQIIPDAPDDNLSETELRRRRVAFFDQKKDNNGQTISDTILDNSVDTGISGGSPVTSNSSSEQETTYSVCDKSSCDSVPHASREEKPTDGQSSGVSQSEDGLQPEDNQHEASLEDEVRDDGTGRIRIRLKYLNDTQRNVVASPTDTVGQFRRVNFASELQDNKVVRFIFNGRDLRSDTMTLDSYNVVDNSVLHCLITQMNRESPPPRADTEGGFDMGTIMLPLFGVILCIMWYLRFEYRPFFSATSTISLFGITSLYVAAVLASWESHRRGHHVHDHID
ncbi:transmembrane and ubiquitin-like domain-containing protein 1 [Argopecten irradians]|uniref:transmembrane and ubiquitin-like domain-containing protein 1 n=1 Tax=Argopecten irradians TaxID=31199 RepID=UPI00371A3600